VTDHLRLWAKLLTDGVIQYIMFSQRTHIRLVQAALALDAEEVLFGAFQVVFLINCD